MTVFPVTYDLFAPVRGGCVGATDVRTLSRPRRVRAGTDVIVNRRFHVLPGQAQKMLAVPTLLTVECKKSRPSVRSPRCARTLRGHKSEEQIPTLLTVECKKVTCARVIAVKHLPAGRVRAPSESAESSLSRAYKAARRRAQGARRWAADSVRQLVVALLRAVNR